MYEISFVGDFRLLKKPTISEKESIKRLFLQSSKVVANLEAPMPKNTSYLSAQKWAIISQPQWVPAELTDMGITHVGLANNHMMDYGGRGLVDTMECLKLAGIEYFGAGNNIQHALEPGRIAIGGKKITIVGVSCTSPPGSAAFDNSAGIASIPVHTDFYVDNYFLMENPGTPPSVVTSIQEDSTQMLMDLMKKERKETDVLVIFVHWGVPFQHKLADYQIQLAHQLVEHGADVIVGHHTHTIQGIEVYRKKPIFYGLGHFLFTQEAKKYALKGYRNPFPPNAGQWGPSPVNLSVHMTFSHKAIEYYFTMLRSEEGEIPRVLTGRDLSTGISQLKELSRQFDATFDASAHDRFKLCL